MLSPLHVEMFQILNVKIIVKCWMTKISQLADLAQAMQRGLLTLAQMLILWAAVWLWRLNNVVKPCRARVNVKGGCFGAMPMFANQVVTHLLLDTQIDGMRNLYRKALDMPCF